MLKHCCFICLWESQRADNFYVTKEWPVGEEFSSQKCNVKYTPKVDPQLLLLHLLYIQLWLTKNSVKALD